MASPLSADLLQDVEDWAVDYVIAMLEGVVELMQVDGRVYGDVLLNRGERILSFEAAVRSGEMDSLPVVNAGLARRMEDQYERDMADMPVMRE
ncbi:MAG: hypothetical protein NUW22_13935 [Acidobacteria bacterium]|nr:hypothetical protein [Acidobacteriota bacterium]